jgi:golgi SNAP receptor complex member 1
MKIKLIQKFSGSTDALSRAEGGGLSSSNTSSSLSSSTPSSSSIQQDIVLYQQEIPILITTLNDIIHKKLSVTAVTPSQRAIITRYEQVLRDIKLDYDRSKQQYIRYYERNELFTTTTNHSNGNNTTSGNGSDSNNDPAMDALLRERNSLQSSMNHTNTVISQAEHIRMELHGQGRALRNTNSIIGQMTSYLPNVNTLIDTIRRRRHSDDTIVAIVIAICITFTFWYLFG